MASRGSSTSWKWAWVIGVVLCAIPCQAQSFNLGAGVVHSDGLGFDSNYGLGIVEASWNYPSIHLRLGVEILNAEKTGQDGWGGQLDFTITKPVTDKWGVLAYYRPTYISQTDYSKDAHIWGAGIAISTKSAGRWDFFAGLSPDEYRTREWGFEWRYGSGHWLRVKAFGVNLKHPVSGDRSNGSRVSVSVAPRIRW